ncbi:MAG: hypothetical protein J0I34_03620 [Pseudonocardia sp.]|uniref:hypothetical protein n=1 Tax=unclassified Pseudonocardia TaxID=2619320 RepID=UPI00086A2F8B|nr:MULTISPECIES: hypothetical protein [unclassified Pseudonocardia]MBN9107851.1 hypothetical protein [Pseudonocardia sp.]ODV07454.1 MAG: hypothetical protein ABT15_08140 [Pseudonocardia sp. SCN 73-27]
MAPSTPGPDPGEREPREPDGDGRDDRFGWEGGAPGYTPVDPDRLTPHAPMPGAPPYPAAEELPPPPVGDTATGTRLRTPMLAAALWGVVDTVLVLAVSGPPPSSAAGWALGGMIVAAVLVAGLLTWVVGRRRAWPFWVVLLVTGLLFWIVRVATTAGVA